MLFSRATSKFLNRLVLVPAFTLSVGGCVALDEYINPYYNDELDAEDAREQSTQQAQASVGAVSDQSAGDSESPAKDAVSTEQPSADIGAPNEEVAAPSLLATAGPNPFLSPSAQPSAATQAQYHQALSAMRAEDWSSAERLLASLVQSNPLLSGPLLNLGIAQVNQGKDELAQKSFESAIKVNESNQEAYNQLGMLHRKHGRFTEAKNTYLRAIAVWPAYAPIRLNLGILFELYIGDLAQALNQYQAYQSLQTEPDRKVLGWIKDLERRLQVTRS